MYFGDTYIVSKTIKKDKGKITTEYTIMLNFEAEREAIEEGLS